MTPTPGQVAPREPRPLGCPDCRACGLWHCSDPLHCGGMQWEAAAQAVRAMAAAGSGHSAAAPPGAPPVA